MDPMEAYLDSGVRQAAKVGGRRAAPTDERHDATLQVAKAVAPAAPKLTQNELVKAALALAPQLDRVVRYNGSQRGTPKTGRYDAFNIFQDFNYLQRPAPLGFSQLRTLPSNDPILASIVLSRQRQVTRLLRPKDYDYEPGFKIRLRGRRGRLHEADRDRIRWLEKFVMNCGAEFDPFARDYAGRDSLKSYVSKLLLDSLIMDASVTEILRTYSGRVHGFCHVDGSQIYLAPEGGLPGSAPLPENLEPEDMGELPEREYVKAVEVGADTTIVNWLAYGDILYDVRNPRPDLFGRGYGMAETEFMLRIITALMNVLTYNQKAYDDNHIPKGLLQLTGDYTAEQVEELKAAWAAYLGGVDNAWGLPLVVAKPGEVGANILKFGMDVGEMQFIKFTSLLVTVEHALYGMDPEENSFEGFSSKGASLSDGSIDSKLENSRDKGLMPLVMHVEDHLNTILHLVDEDAEFVFTGFVSAKEAWERDQRALFYGELRERQGLDPSGDDDLDRMPLDALAQQVYLQKIGQQQMQGFAGEDLNAMPGMPQGFPVEMEEAPGQEAEAIDAEAEAQATAQPGEDRAGAQPSLKELREALLTQ